MQTIHILLYAIVVIVRRCHASVILVYPDTEERFLTAKNPSNYDVDKDVFDKLSVDERIDLCDKAIQSPTYMHVTDGDISNYRELPLTDNYQRMAKYDSSLRAELNVVDAVGVKIKDEIQTFPFKRFLCSVFDMQARLGDWWYQELYVAAGTEKNVPFVMVRNYKNEALELMGLIVSDEAVWKPVQVGGYDARIIVKNVHANPDSICSLKSTNFKYEICSRVHHHRHPQNESEEEEWDDDYSPYYYDSDEGFSDSSDIFSESELERETHAVDEQETHSEVGAAAVVQEKTISQGAVKENSQPEHDADERTALLAGYKERDSSSLASATAKLDLKVSGEEKAVPLTGVKGKANSVAVVDEKTDSPIADNGKTDSLNGAEEKTDLHYDDGQEEEDEDEEEDDFYDADYYAPTLHEWYDRGEEACNIKSVNVGEKAMNIDALACPFGDSETDHAEIYVALKSMEKNKVSVAVMTSKDTDTIHNEKNGELEVQGILEFERH